MNILLFKHFCIGFIVSEIPRVSVFCYLKRLSKHECLNTCLIIIQFSDNINKQHIFLTKI